MDAFKDFNIALDIISASEKDTSKKKGICKHERIINERERFFCIDCGELVETKKNFSQEWRYYGVNDTKNFSNPTRVHMRKKEDRNIYRDVQNMGIDENVVNCANEIYHQVTNNKIKRGNSRKGIVFACIFEAYKINGNPQTYETLINNFNLTKKAGLAGIKHVSLNMSKDSKVKTTYITPIHIIKDILFKFKGATDVQYNEVICIYECIKNKSTKLNRARPQSVAAGVVYYWIQLENKSISLKDFSNVVKLSELTIGKMSKLVKSILDKERKKKLKRKRKKIKTKGEIEEGKEDKG